MSVVRLKVSISDLYPYVERKEDDLIIHLFERDTSVAYGYLKLINVNDKLQVKEIKCEKHEGKEGFKCIKVTPEEGAMVKLEQYYHNRRTDMTLRTFIVLRYEDNMWKGYQDVV